MKNFSFTLLVMFLKVILTDGLQSTNKRDYKKIHQIIQNHNSFKLAPPEIRGYILEQVSLGNHLAMLRALDILTQRENDQNWTFNKTYQRK